jgi:archaeosine-15-forming tRNA-guanine transglycosylase
MTDEAKAVIGCTASFKVSKQGRMQQVHVQGHRVWTGK